MEEATRAMNDATQEMRDYAYIQTWLVGFGTLLVFGSLVAALLANRAAFDAVRVTREVGEKQTRAYVGFENISPNFVVEEKSGVARHIVFSCNFKNTRQTPAEIIYCEAAVAFGKHNEDVASVRLRAKGQPIGNFSCGSGESRFCKTEPISTQDFDDAIKNGISVFVVGRVRYRHL